MVLAVVWPLVVLAVVWPLEPLELPLLLLAVVEADELDPLPPLPPEKEQTPFTHCCTLVHVAQALPLAPQ